jgi:hypothetical protein
MVADLQAKIRTGNSKLQRSIITLSNTKAVTKHLGLRVIDPHSSVPLLELKALVQFQDALSVEESENQLKFIDFFLSSSSILFN